MIVAKFLLALCKIAFMELNPSLMVLDQGKTFPVLCLFKTATLQIEKIVRLGL